MAKPYDGNPYWAMEHWPGSFYPTPWNWSPSPHETPIGGEYVDPTYPPELPDETIPPGEDAKGKPFCVLADIDGATIDDCVKHTYQLSNGLVRHVFYTVRHEEDGDDLSATDIDIYSQKGPKQDKICGGKWPLGDDQIVIDFDDDTPTGRGTVIIEAVMEAIDCRSTLEAGTSVCYAEVRIECCSCSQDINPFEFDFDSTPETIAAGGSISVYVTGGCPPFTWSVSGLGYTLNEAETTVRNNVLNCVAGDCPDDCDSTFGPMATLTIVDHCGTSLTATIQNGCGEWEFTERIRQSEASTPDMCDDYPECTGSWYFDRENTGFHYYGSFCPSPCGEPTCTQYICDGNGYYADKYTWVCWTP